MFNFQSSIFNFNFSLFAILLLAACSSSDDTPAPEPVVPAQRTVIAYFEGNNNLRSSLNEDIKEIESGSKSLSATTNLILFANIYGQKPYIAEVAGGKLTKVREWESTFYATHPDSMLSVMRWITEKYPANEYGIIFGGHGTGSLLRQDTVPTLLRPAYAYGWDYDKDATDGKRWMNTHTLATVISQLPHMKFVFFDCCLMQDVDVVRQMRKYTDYLISPVSETPIKGAPYTDIVPILSTENVESLCDQLLTIYRNNSSICISALRTSGVDNLWHQATQALNEVRDNLAGKGEDVSYDDVIYYEREKNKDPQLYDLKSFLYEQKAKDNLSATTYQNFLTALQQCIFSSRLAQRWATGYQIDFYDFTVTDDNYGGISVSRATIEE